MYLLLTLPLCITISAFSQSLWRVCARFTKILHLFWASNSSNRNVRMLVWYAGMKRFKKAITMFHHLWNDDHVKKQSQHSCWSPRVGEAWAGVGETSQNAEHSISHRSEWKPGFCWSLIGWPWVVVLQWLRGVVMIKRGVGLHFWAGDAALDTATQWVVEKPIICQDDQMLIWSSELQTVFLVQH